MFSNYYIVDVNFWGSINKLFNELNNVYGQLYNSRNNINNLDQTGDDRLTFDVSVIEIYTSPGRQARSFIISNCPRRKYLHTTAGPVYPGFQRGGGCIRSGQVR